MEIGAANRQEAANRFGRRLNRNDDSRRRLARLLEHRLREKIQNYERAAGRLKSSGDIDAATVLIAAADKLRLIAIAP